MKKLLPLFLIPIPFCIATFLFLYVRGKNLALFNPQGTIALQERNLIFVAVFLMLIVAIPVFIATFVIAVRYRASNNKATYAPEWTGNKKLKFTWWGILIALAFILAIIVWNGAHELDPYKPLDSQVKPITIRVVALNWKWLFIYPEQNIATVNFVAFPEKTPINFELTADAPMNSFWIPQLGGQMYAMAGMQTQLHLLASKTGEFPGSEVEINGSGFSGMKFIAKSVSSIDFTKWVQSIKQSSKPLDLATYTALAKPSMDTPTMYYSSVEKDLYNTIIMKYMMPETQVKNQN